MPAPSKRRNAEFTRGRTYERYAGEHTRGRVTAEGAAAGGVAAAAAAGASSLSGAKIAGTPLGQHVLGTAERRLSRMPGEHHQLAAGQVGRYKRYGAWAAKNRLKSTGGIVGLTGLAAGARIAQRVRQNEEAGISQGIGRMKAGEHYERTSTRIGKSVLPVAALATDLQAHPKTGQAARWVLDNRGKLVKTGAAAAGVVGGVTAARVGHNHAREIKQLRRELRPTGRVSKGIMTGGRGFMISGVGTGLGGLGVSGELHRRKHEDASRQAMAGTIGGWAGQGAYQAAGYGPKHLVLRAERKAIARDKGKPQPKMVKGKPVSEPPMTKSRLSREQGKHAKLHGGKGSVEYFRNYPGHLPGHTANRVLGWTHRGRTGNALGSAATAAGALGATKYVSRRQKEVAKALYQREERLSPLRTAQFAAGAGVAAWGLGRSRFLGSALARGIKVAQRSNNAHAVEAMQLALAAQGALRRGTAPGERALRQIRRVDRAINAVPRPIRPEVAVAAGAVLAGNSMPLHHTSYRPVSVSVRPTSVGW